MAQRFRRLCSPPETKSNPAKPSSSFVLFPTTSCPPPLAPRELLKRLPLAQEKSPVHLALRLARPSLPRPLPPPRRTARTRCAKPLRYLLQPKTDPPHVQSRRLQDR